MGKEMKQPLWTTYAYGQPQEWPLRDTTQNWLALNCSVFKNISEGLAINSGKISLFL